MTMETDLQIEIDRLKQRQQVLLLGILVLGGFLLYSTLGDSKAYASDNTIECQKIELSEKDGEVQMRLSAGTQGPKVELFDSAGKTRLSLAFNEKKGSQVTIKDASKKTRACLSLSEDMPALYLYDTTGKVRTAVFSMSKNGRGGMQTYDQANRVVKDY